MPKFLFAYHGGVQPNSNEDAEKMIKAWGDWLEGLSDSVIDGGNPVGQSITVNSDKSVVDNGGQNPVSGYGIFTAASLETAIEVAKSCPILTYSGSVEVAEIHDV